MQVRSWRDAGITWSIVRGDDVVKVQRRAGHKLIGTTMRYIVEAENRGATFAKVRAKWGIDRASNRQCLLIRCERRELKPNGRREIGEKTALVRVAPEGACTNGRESCSFAAPSRSFVHSASEEELHAAIAAVTRALAESHDRDQVLDLARERASLRCELRDLEVRAAGRPARRDRVA